MIMGLLARIASIINENGVIQIFKQYTYLPIHMH